MIEVVFGGPGADLARRVGLSHEQVSRTFNDAVNDPARALFVPGRASKLYAIRWFEDGHIVYADGVVTGWRGAAGGDAEGAGAAAGPPEAPSIDQVEWVSTNFALSLTPHLPAGDLDPRARLPDLLPVIANSFGTEIVCRQDAPLTKLYTGPWDGHGVAIRGHSEAGGILTGTLETATMMCHYVWVLSFDLYLQWWDVLQGKPSGGSA